MHLFEHLSDLCAQFRGEGHLLPPADFAVVQGSFRDVTAQHGFQTHSLPAQLEGVACVLPGFSPLVLHRIGLPQPILSGKRDAGAAPVVFQHITLAGDTQFRGIDADAPLNLHISPAFRKRPVVGVFMHQRAVHRAVVFRPLVLDVNQRPLAAAEGKVLQP